MQRCSPRKRAREEDANNSSSLGHAARRVRHDPEAAPQPPAAPQPQRETSSDDDNSSTTITKAKAEEEARVTAEGTALVSSAAPPTKRPALGHFETSLVLSTSTGLTGPQKEKIIARLTRAGEGRMARVRGDFVDTHCADAPPAKRAAVDERVRCWLDDGVHDGFESLYGVLEEQAKLKLPKALEMCAPPAAMRSHACRAARAHATDTRAIVCCREDAAANDKYGEAWCEIFAPLHLVKVLRKLKPPLLPPGGCAVCHTEDASAGGHIFSCTHRCAFAVARTATRRRPAVFALIMPDVSLVLVQVVRRVLPEAAQDGGAGRRAQGAVLPAVPARVPKDHGVARHAAAGRRVAGGALDVRANPAPPQCYGAARNARRKRKGGVVAAAALAP